MAPLLALPVFRARGPCTHAGGPCSTIFRSGSIQNQVIFLGRAGEEFPLAPRFVTLQEGTVSASLERSRINSRISRRRIFPDPRERDLVDEDDFSRDLEARQMAAAVIANVFLAEFTESYDGCADPLAEVGIGHSRHRSIDDGGMASQRLFDLTGTEFLVAAVTAARIQSSPGSPSDTSAPLSGSTSR